MSTSERPTKAQNELLEFIDNFIRQHGYGPSYREIMRALGLKSVSTVAVHVDNLIRAGRLAKTDRSARSLVVVDDSATVENSLAKPQNSDWLVSQVEQRLQAYQAEPSDEKRSELQTLVKALQILGLEKQAQAIQIKLDK